MKKLSHQSLILLTVAIATLATGCNRSNPVGESPATSDANAMSLSNAWQKTKETTTNAWENAKEGATNAWADTKGSTMQAWEDVTESMGPATDYTYDKKDEFVSKANTDLKAMDQKIIELSNQAAKVGESAKDEAQAKIQDLRSKRAGLDQSLDNVKNATETDWNDAKTAFKNSYADVQNSVKQAWQWLSDKLGS